MRSLLRLFFLFFISLHLYADNSSLEALHKKVQAVLGSQQGEYFSRNIERIGNNTVRFEAFISLEGDSKLFTKIMSDYKGLPSWIIRNINQRPGGGNYYSQVRTMTPDSADPSLMHMVFAVNLPAFKQVVERDFRLQSKTENGIFIVSTEAMPSEKSVLETASGSMYLFTPVGKSNLLWLYVTTDVKIRSWILYQALPDRLLKRESGERIGIVLANYQAEEDRWRRKSTPELTRAK